MKKNLIGISLLALLFTSCFSSTSTSIEKSRTVSTKTINGETVATVTTTENGVTTTKTYKGKAADKFLEENNKEAMQDIEPVEMPELPELDDLSESENRMVKMENVNGKKTLTIEEEKNGKKIRQVYTGSEADKKLKELKAEK